MAADLVLLSPLDGWVSPLSETPDPVFAQAMLGDGLAIDPTGSTLCAPSKRGQCRTCSPIVASC